jgi:phosphate/sulfate permease
LGNARNDMYLVSEALRFLTKDKEADLNAQDLSMLNAYKGSLDGATKFIPYWVKIIVAIALGLGTMVGWKRIVVTVGEKIGKTHLTYAQGACAEITAAATIAAADGYGLPVSTTHVLSSGIAGTMAAKWLRTAMVDHPQHRARLGSHATGRDGAFRHPLLHLLASVLSVREKPSLKTKSPGACAGARSFTMNRFR